MAAGALMNTTATPNDGTAPATLRPWASRPPSLLQPATHPVARPRTRTGVIIGCVRQQNGKWAPQEPKITNVKGTRGLESELKCPFL